MRQQARRIASPGRYLLLVLALVLTTGTVAADSRTEARTHYQAGVKFYNGGDYKSAIREFSAAQQLAPADLNNYNLALCYDKLGDPEPAIQYYRAYLDKVPSTDKRAEIEASVARLEAASRSVAAKKAEEARKIEDARRAADERKAAEDARRADDAAKAAAAEDARRAEEQRKADELARKAVPPPTVDRAPPPISGGAGSTGTPSSGVAPSTGDAQLDRVQGIDINSVRDQRVGGASSGMVEPRTGPSSTAGATAGGAIDPDAPPPPAGGPTAQSNAPDGGAMPAEVPKKPTPVYKKWWFWAVVAVSAYVVYAIATEDSKPESGRAREMLPLGPARDTQMGGGATLLRW